MKQPFKPLLRTGGLLLALAATLAWADEMPTRKAGLWEMKMSGGADVTTRQCVSPEVEKKMQEAALSGGMDCSQMDIRKTASGYAIDAACKVGSAMNVTSHSEFTGDFNSAYTMKQTGRVEMKGQKPQDTSVTIQAKWLGPCPPDWKPGDVEIPGGGKVNMAGGGAGTPAGGKRK